MENYLSNKPYDTKPSATKYDAQEVHAGAQDVFVFPDKRVEEHAVTGESPNESWWSLIVYWIKEIAWRRRFWNQTRSRST